MVRFDLGLNDVSTGAVLTDAQATAIIDNAKLLIAAFLADNAVCKIIICLPKSHSSDFFITSRRQSVYRVSIHKLRKALLAAFDFNAGFPKRFYQSVGLWYRSILWVSECGSSASGPNRHSNIYRHYGRCSPEFWWLSASRRCGYGVRVGKFVVE
jgi:hypothetical protein